MILLFQAGAEIGWERWIGEGVAISLIVIFLIFILRAMPTWKEVKIAELDVRTKEADVQLKVAESLGTLGGAMGQLGGALTQLGEVTKDIAIEQRRATETTQILQRANNEEAGRILIGVEEMKTGFEDMKTRMNEFEHTLEVHKPNAKRARTN